MDSALSSLEREMAQLKEQKQAGQTTISSAVLAVPISSRGGTVKSEQARQRALSKPSTPAAGFGTTLRPLPSPLTASRSEARTRAMRTATLHLLALEPLSKPDILRQTHIPHADLSNVLDSLAIQTNGKYELTSKAYRDLDVWKFRYASQNDRQKAIDNAIRAFDRQRIEKDEKVWQMLLPEADRGKGIYLSKLTLGAGNLNRGLTPRHAASPDAAEHSAGGMTPRAGLASSPKVSSKNGAALTKRLFAKDPQKQRAAEQAKEKKRKAEKAATSDVESGKPARKKQATGTASSSTKYKSAELVHSSDDETGGEIEVSRSASRLPKKPKPSSAAAEGRSTPTHAPARAAAREGPGKAAEKSSASSEDVPLAKARLLSSSASKPPAQPEKKPAKTAPAPMTAAKPSVPAKAVPGKAPSAQPSKTQLSPRKGDSRPTVPSPLGAARPRVASDVSDHAGVGVQQRVRQGAATPINGLATANGSSTGQDGRARKALARSDGVKKPTTAERPVRIDAAAAALAKPDADKPASDSRKRKADIISPPDVALPPSVKHRKTESSSSSLSSPGADHAGFPLMVSSSAILDNITFKQGVGLAEQFNRYYPAYLSMHDDLSERKGRGERVGRDERERLMVMHARLRELKAQMRAASAREHVGD